MDDKTDDSGLTLLDLGAGLGGWSIGFHREGFQCKGIDIVDVGYPYELILCDVREYHPDYSPSVVVASMPCTEFSKLTKLSYAKGQRGPPEPEKGIVLVKEAYRVIIESKCNYWIMENVFGSINYLEPILGKPRVVSKPWVLWGNFPEVMFQFEPTKQRDVKISHTFEHNGKGGDIFGKGGGRFGLPEDFAFDPLRSWKRARIPVFLAQAMAKICRSELING